MVFVGDHRRALCRWQHRQRRIKYFLSLIFAASMTLSATAASAQAAISPNTSPPPTFDVASIRPMSNADDVPSHISNPSKTSEFRAVNVTLRALLEVAYALPETQMFGGPGWTATDKFAIEAKSDQKFDQQLAVMSPSKAKQAKRDMLRNLLAERFKLAAHTETRERPIFALIVAKGGSKLIQSKSSKTALSGGRGRISIKGGDDSLAVLAFELSWRLGRPVMDHTGLEGRYELNLNWAADDGEPIASDSSSGPSLFTAIQEQLGLKLEPTKAPVPILIIDHADKPSQN
jgi:uncharacterized protein (TIGR03435 family)